MANEMVAVPIVDNVAQMNSVFTLNHTAAFIVGMMREPVSMDEILAAVTSEFEVDMTQARNDISEIIEKGMGLGIIIEE
jgi:hypothetical protein